MIFAGQPARVVIGCEIDQGRLIGLRTPLTDHFGDIMLQFE
jgi:hypothetical protein